MVKDIDDRPVVAAFDFDGTLTYHDTLIYFLIYAFGFWKTFFFLFLRIPALVAFALGRITRAELKERILTRFFAGIPLEQVRKQGEAFAATGLLRHLRPEGMKRLAWHQKQGHRCILVSASMDVYLEPWAKAAGFQDVLTSRFACDFNGNITGKLAGLNCRCEEKVRRLTELLGSLGQYTLYAYGDSRGDKELLEAADFPYYCEMPEK